MIKVIDLTTPERRSGGKHFDSLSLAEKESILERDIKSYVYKVAFYREQFENHDELLRGNPGNETIRTHMVQLLEYVAEYGKTLVGLYDMLVKIRPADGNIQEARALAAGALAEDEKTLWRKLQIAAPLMIEYRRGLIRHGNRLISENPRRSRFCKKVMRYHVGRIAEYEKSIGQRG